MYKLSDFYGDKMNINKENSERTKVVKDFCFPDGVPLIKLDYDPNRKTQPEEVEEII